MTPKIRKTSNIINVIPKMLGIACIEALTATFKPSFLLIKRKDLKILSTFINLNCSAYGDRHKYENIRTIKSSMFQKFFR